MISMAEGPVIGVFNQGASGTTSATVFVKPGNAFSEITDLAWRLDAGVTTGLIIIRTGEAKYDVNSATSGSGTAVWFANTGSDVASADYIIIYDESTGDYLLRHVTAVATTSVTVSESISVGLTTSDKVWLVSSSVQRAVPNTISSASALSIWLPKDAPTAITVDGNTTSCRISVSGVKRN